MTGIWRYHWSPYASFDAFSEHGRFTTTSETGYRTEMGVRRSCPVSSCEDSYQLANKQSSKGSLQCSQDRCRIIRRLACMVLLVLTNRKDCTEKWTAIHLFCGPSYNYKNLPSLILPIYHHGIHTHTSLDNVGEQEGHHEVEKTGGFGKGETRTAYWKS